MRRNSYRSQSWAEFITVWLCLLVGFPLGLAFAGLVLKVVCNCFMAGWRLV